MITVFGPRFSIDRCAVSHSVDAESMSDSIDSMSRCFNRRINKGRTAAFGTIGTGIASATHCHLIIPLKQVDVPK